MTRWIMAIQEHAFIIKYCKTTKNRVADIRSRYAPVKKEKHIRENTDVRIISIKYESPQELKQRLRNSGTEQDQDPNILKRKNNLRQRDHPSYKVEENVLYKLMDNRWKIIVPQHLVENII